MNFYFLGQVMIDKNPGITSAVNKISNIDNTYRNFQMEVLAGEENMTTKVQSILLFPNKIDFEKLMFIIRIDEKD
jgi:tRNA (guanine37-N1)-methyltransferase